jgi:hypothetical protein
VTVISTRTELARPDLISNFDIAELIGIAHALLDARYQLFDALFLWQTHVRSNTSATKQDESCTKYDQAEGKTKSD